MKKNHWTTDPIIFCVFASWAVAFVLINKSLTAKVGAFSPLAFVWPRMFLSALIMFALLPIIRQPMRIPRKYIGKTVVIGVVGLGGYHLLFTIALSMTTPVDTALIIGTGPVMTALWMPLFGMPKPRARAWLGIVTCFVTVAFIAVSGAAGKAGDPWDMRRLIGDLIMLVAANCWALNGIFCRRLTHLRPMTITAYGMLWASAALLPVCLFGIGVSEFGGLVQQDWRAISGLHWGYFAYAVLPASTLSIVFFYFGVKKVGPLHTIIYQNVSPIITAVVVYLMDAKVPSMVQMLGVVTIFLGVYLTRTSKPKVPDEPIDP